MLAWVTDENGNKCSVGYFGSVEAAQEALDSLINCEGCVNCERCTRCTRCKGCEGCTGCVDCEECKNCTCCRGCKKCISCVYCHFCINHKSCKDLCGDARCLDNKKQESYWQPIATAPHDNTPVLCGFYHYKKWVTFVDRFPAREQSKGAYAFPDWWAHLPPPPSPEEDAKNQSENQSSERE